MLDGEQRVPHALEHRGDLIAELERGDWLLLGQGLDRLLVVIWRLIGAALLLVADTALPYLPTAVPHLGRVACWA